MLQNHVLQAAIDRTGMEAGLVVARYGDSSMPTLESRTAVSEPACIRGVGPWQDYVNAHFPTLRLASLTNEPFIARARCRTLDDYSLTHITTSASRVVRTARQARASEHGYLKVFWLLSGHMRVSQDRRSVMLHPGGVSLCDTARAYDLQIAEGTYLAVLMIPHDMDHQLPRYARRVSATAISDIPVMQAALGAVTGLMQSGPAADGQSTHDVMHAVIQMLSSSLRRSHTDEDKHRYLRRAIQFISAHQASRSLDPARLAAALGLSRRCLYQRLSHYNTTPARLIMEVRLRHARRALTRPSGASPGITELALECGFADSAHFSRAFKQRFGISPSMWCKQNRHSAP